MQKPKNDKRKNGDAEFADLVEPGRLGYSASDGAVIDYREEIGCSAYSGGAVDYVTSGSPWSKLLLAMVFMLIPVVGQFFLAGYGLRATRNVLNGDYRLPEWDDLGGDFIRGVMVSVGSFLLGLILTISMITIVMIPVVFLFGFPFVAYSMARYAATDDFSVFFDVVTNAKAVFSRAGNAVLLLLGGFFLVVVGGIAVGLGTIACLIPGLMAAAALNIAFYYQIGIYGRSMGLGSREK